MDRPDQPTIYENFQRSEDARQDNMSSDRKWRSNLAKRLSHKAVDIAVEDDMGDINVTNNSSGMGWKELAVCAVLLIGGVGGVVGGFLLSRPTLPMIERPIEPAIDTDTKYDLRFVEPK